MKHIVNVLAISIALFGRAGQAQELECASCCDCVGGFVGGVDVVFMKPIFGRAHNVQETTEINFDLDVGYRPWIGFVNECGLGIQARYFHIENVAGVPANSDFADGLADQPAEFRIEVENIDIEVIQRISLCSWEATLSSGIRFGSIEERFTEVGPAADERAFTKFEGVGPTFGVSARRPIGQHGLALFNSVRGAVLYGERSYANDDDDIPLVGDDLVTEFEAQLGAEYSRCLCNGAILSIRAAFETQMMINGGQFFSEDQLQNDTVPDDGYDAAADLGLIGFSIGASIDF